MRVITNQSTLGGGEPAPAARLLEHNRPLAVASGNERRCLAPRHLSSDIGGHSSPERRASNSAPDESRDRGSGLQPTRHASPIRVVTEHQATHTVSATSLSDCNDTLAVAATIEPLDDPHVWFDARILQR